MLPFFHRIFLFLRLSIILKPYDSVFYNVATLRNETPEKNYVMVAKVSDSLAIERANVYETEASAMSSTSKS